MPVIILLIFVSPLFFFKLGQSSLVSWDEAWYAEVARNLIESKDYIYLMFNGSRFMDHPPAGFWLIAASQKVLGFTELGARAASAISALITLVLVYILGKTAFSRSVGFASALALASAPWFVTRGRSGNLDIFLTMFTVSTFLLFLLFCRRRIYLLPFWISLTLLLLTKTMVPFTILPSLLVMSLIYRLPPGYLVISLLVPWLIFSQWTKTQALVNPDFFKRYFIIGLPQVKTSSSSSSYLTNILQIKSYLHFGIGLWFRSVILSLPIGAILSPKKFLPFLVFIFSFLLPFMFSAKGQIWHLIPVFPFLLICFFGFIHTLLSRFRVLPASIIILSIAILLFAKQSYRNWHEFIDIPSFISDEAILPREAGKYPHELVIDEDFVPAAVYYSGKNVIRANITSLTTLFQDRQPRLIITHDWSLERDDIPPSSYQLLKKDRDRVLILTK